MMMEGINKPKMKRGIFDQIMDAEKILPLGIHFFFFYFFFSGIKLDFKKIWEQKPSSFPLLHPRTFSDCKFEPHPHIAWSEGGNMIFWMGSCKNNRSILLDPLETLRVKEKTEKRRRERKRIAKT